MHFEIISFIILNGIVTTFTILLLRPFAQKYKLVDKPDFRKDHKGDVPFIGGICIFINLMFSQIYLSEQTQIISLLLITSFLILTVGTWDDIANLKAKTKFIFQILLILITIILVDIRIETLSYFPGLPSLNLGYAAIPFTIIGICGLLNAFNMIDGSDGVAGSLAIIAIIGIFLKTFLIEDYMFFYILLGLISSLTSFLFFNVLGGYKNKIFLGDGGSLFLGFIIAFVLVYNSQKIDDFTATYALWCVALIIFDFFSVIIIRKVGKYPLHIASKDHIHHVLRDLGLPKGIILIVIVSLGLAFLFIGYFLENNFKALSFPFLVISFIIYFFLRYLLIANKKNQLK